MFDPSDREEADHCPHCGAILRDPPTCCIHAKLDDRRDAEIIRHIFSNDQED